MLMTDEKIDPFANPVDWEAKYKEVHTDYQILIDEKNAWKSKYHALNEDFTNYSEQVSIKLTHLEAQNMTLKDLIFKSLVEAQTDE